MLASGDAGQHAAPGLPEAGGDHAGALASPPGHAAEAPMAGAHLVHGAAAGGPSSHAEHAPPGLHSWVGIFTSLRFYMFAAIGLGVVGAPVTALGLSPPGLTLVVA